MTWSIIGLVLGIKVMGDLEQLVSRENYERKMAQTPKLAQTPYLALQMAKYHCQVYCGSSLVKQAHYRQLERSLNEGEWSRCRQYGLPSQCFGDDAA